MKRWMIISGVLCLLIAFSRPAFAIQMGGYLDNRLQIIQGDIYENTMTGFNKLKLDFQVNADTYFLCGTITGINLYSTNESNSIALTRAYLELYPTWGRVTAGLQNIAWGSGYLFNLADQFNAPNPFDPKGEKKGINALRVKWNFSPTGFLETAALPGDTVGNSNYGLRSNFTLGRFDLTANYLKKDAEKTTVIELKGEIGDSLPGVWAQYAATESNDYRYTFGGDYTIDAGNGLYLLTEYHRDFRMGGSDQLYGLIRYSPAAYLTISLSTLTDIQNQADLFSINLRYQLNDNIDFGATYNYYPVGSNKLRMLKTLNNNIDIDQELILELKTSF
ncbi:MAG: hypothetical protein K6U80_17340 [Firmicutes bacterium]|nr:hypothetical protein [Bacillota bacterium]